MSTRKVRWIIGAGLPLLAGALLVQAAQDKIDAKRLLLGQAAFLDYRSMKPGTFRKITRSTEQAPMRLK